MSNASLARAPLRAAAVLLITLSAAAVLGGCAGGSGDYWRERPASQNYMRLPVR